MFNKKKIEELEERMWRLENPPKFKVGDVVEVMSNFEDDELCIILDRIEMQKEYYYSVISEEKEIFNHVVEWSIAKSKKEFKLKNE